MNKRYYNVKNHQECKDLEEKMSLFFKNYDFNEYNKTDDSVTQLNISPGLLPTEVNIEPNTGYTSNLELIANEKCKGRFISGCVDNIKVKIDDVTYEIKYESR
jgi:hypothetical protein